MRVAARYFDGRSAAAIPVELALAPDGTVCLTGPVGVRSYRLADIRVSTRLGSVPRELRLPDGGLCEVTDHAALDSLLAAARYRDPADWVHRLEQHWGWALTAVVAVAAILAFAVLVGIPMLARTVAATIPPELDRVLGEQALAALDQMLLRPTTVSPEGKAELRALLAGWPRMRRASGVSGWNCGHRTSWVPMRWHCHRALWSLRTSCWRRLTTMISCGQSWPMRWVMSCTGIRCA